MSASDALKKYMQRQLDEMGRRGVQQRRNDNPEAQFEIELRKEFVSLGFSMHKVEARAVYNYEAGRYMQGQAVKGMPDYIGCVPGGVAAFVEAKAPGRRSTLKEHQREFLLDKIKRGCFVCCVDTVVLLRHTWAQWENLVTTNRPIAARAWLIESLPKQRVSEQAGLFDGEDI